MRNGEHTHTVPYTIANIEFKGNNTKLPNTNTQQKQTTEEKKNNEK